MPGTSCRKCAIVAAVTKDGGLGNAGRLPWHPRRLSLDLAFLQFISTNDFEISSTEMSVQLCPRKSNQPQNPVIMGRKTWESLPPRFRPLKNRTNLILTRDLSFSAEGGVVVKSLNEATAMASSLGRPLFVLGGSALYLDSIEAGVADCIFLTELIDHPEMPFDVEFPLSALARYSKKLNITQAAFEMFKEGLKIDETHYLSSRDGDAVFIDGDVSYRIVCYFN
jgi:dihydrofolate reductase